MDFGKAFEGFFVVVVVVMAVGLALGFPVMLLWNEMMPYLFDLPTIDFWQALQLYALCAILFQSTNTGNKSK